jgi:hypothetical protein
MSLYALKREYEERRQALVDQLQRNPSLDPATQHQIYGAIKEIENFLKTIEYQIATEQEKNLNVELSRERPSPIVERTTKMITHVATGTKRVFTHHLPQATKHVVTAPKRYFDRRREERRLKAEIEVEVRRRREAEIAHGTITLEHPHQVLPIKQSDETVHRTMNDHEKRQHVMAKPSKEKARPSRHAKNKKGGQHKPHHKKR